MDRAGLDAALLRAHAEGDKDPGEDLQEQPQESRDGQGPSSSGLVRDAAKLRGRDHGPDEE